MSAIQILTGLYWVNGTVGTPGQSVTLMLDTGSSNTWVNTPKSKLCSQQDDPCKPYGTYDSSKSSTYRFLNHDLNSTYASNQSVFGDFVTDTANFGGVTLKNFEFGVAQESEVEST
jgi:hypothetical protein